MLNIKVVTWSLALFGAVTFVVCVLYGVVVPESVHMTAFLENVLPGFRWLTAGSFFLGLGESILWGLYIGAVYSPIHNFFHRRWAAASPAEGPAQT
jgi:hypothetical protein